MSERIGFHVEIEGAEEAIDSLNTMLGDVTRVTSLVGSADYAFMSWQRTTEEFDIVSFTRSLIATITLMRSLIAVTKMATVSQQALTAAQGQTQLTQWVGGAAAAGASAAGGGSLLSLLGPIGIILALSLSVFTIVQAMDKKYYAMVELLRKDVEERRLNRALYEDALATVEGRRREKYRSVIP